MWKFIKIFFSLLFLYSAGQEYAHETKQTGTYLNIGVIIGSILVLALCTWLIGSSFRKKSDETVLFTYSKYFVISFFVFSFVALESIITYEPPEEYVRINGVTISVGKFIYGNRTFIPDINERKKYSLCIVEKLANSEDVMTEYKKELENGEFGKIINGIKHEDFFLDLNLQNCFDSINVIWTDELANSIKKGLKHQLTGSDFDQTNDIEKYCDCFIKEYRKYPFKVIVSEGTYETEIGNEIDEKCSAESIK